GREQGFRDLLAAVVLDRGDEQGVLVAEVAVDGELGDPGGGRDLVHADAVEAVLQEHALGGLEDRRALGGILGPAGGGPGRRTVGGQGHRKYWTREFGNYSIRRYDGAGSPSRRTGDAGSARVPTDGGGRPRAGAGRLRRRRGRPAAAAAGHGGPPRSRPRRAPVLPRRRARARGEPAFVPRGRRAGPARGGLGRPGPRGPAAGRARPGRLPRPGAGRRGHARGRRGRAAPG